MIAVGVRVEGVKWRYELLEMEVWVCYERVSYTACGGDEERSEVLLHEWGSGWGKEG